MRKITKQEAYELSAKTGQTFYACPTCGKQFKSAEALEKHFGQKRKD